MGWVWLGRHCGTKLYPTRVWGDCQGLLGVDCEGAQQRGRSFILNFCCVQLEGCNIFASNFTGSELQGEALAGAPLNWRI